MVVPRNGSFKLRSPSDQENDMVLPDSNPAASSYDSSYGQYTAPAGVYGDSQPQGFFPDHQSVQMQAIQQPAPQPAMQEAPDIAEAYGVGSQRVNPLINLASSFVRTAIPTLAGGLMGHKPGAMAAWQHASDQAAQERREDEKERAEMLKSVSGNPKFQAPYQRAVSNYNAKNGILDGRQASFQDFLAKEWKEQNGFGFEHQPTLTGLALAAQLNPLGPEAKAYAQMMQDLKSRAAVGPSIFAGASLTPTETSYTETTPPNALGALLGMGPKIKKNTETVKTRPPKAAGAKEAVVDPKTGRLVRK